MISIIISAFNAPEYLIQCLDSIDKQSIPYEVLIGIDHCEKVKEAFTNSKYINYDNIRAFYMKENVGPYVIKNTLYNLAKYESILFFDADDLMIPSTLSVLHNCNTQADLYLFKFYTLKNNERVKGPDMHAHGVFMIKKAILEKSGGFMNWRCAADTEFIERSKYHKVVVHALDEKLFDRRIHENNLTIHANTNMTSPLRATYIRYINDQRSKYREKLNLPYKIKTITCEYEKILNI